MALDSIKLDDLSWGEMVVAIRRRIAAASGGEWTLHAPVDPGVTLLELFAYLLEQRVYWMDQMPDSLVRAALSLLGEHPRTTEAANTVIHIPSVPEVLVLPANQEFTLLRSEPPLVFSGQTEIVLLPFSNPDGQRERVELEIDGKNRTTDLDHGKILRLLPADGSAGEIKISLWLREKLAQNVENKSFSLLFELYETGSLTPQWSPKTHEAVPPASRISWFYTGPNGELLPFSADEINDGTGGLRRSGIITLPIKANWTPEVFDPALKSHKYAVVLRVDKSTFSAPPRLQRLIPNVVIASHQRQTSQHLLKREWLPLPGNQIVLANLPEDKTRKDHPAIENTIKLSLRERDGNWHGWEPTHDLAFHGPSDRVFIANRTLGTITFGDGLTGRLPVLMNDGNDQLKVEYTVGGGTAGRLGADLKWVTPPLQSLNGPPDTRLDLPEIMNVVQTIGGEEPEPIHAFRTRAAAALRSPARAIIADDFKQIACSIPGVPIARAHAAVGFHPHHPCVPIPGAVTVFVVPEVPRPDILGENFDDLSIESTFVAAPVPDEGILARVRKVLDEARLAGTEVIVLSPYYRDVQLSLLIESNAVDRAELSRKIKRRLYRFFDPLIGGDEKEGWPFGEPVRPSAILREAQQELGDQGIVLDISIGLPNKPLPEGSLVSQPSCADVEIGEHRLVKLVLIELRFQRALESQGGLR